MKLACPTYLSLDLLKYGFLKVVTYLIMNAPKSDDKGAFIIRGFLKKSTL